MSDVNQAAFIATGGRSAPADLRRLDFALLLVLTEAVRLRKLSEVARRLGVTQTAISHSVGRLRDIFGDELFIRCPHGVEPTTRAIALTAAAETLIEGASTLLANPAPFDPAAAERTIRIAALDYEVTLLAPAVEALYLTAPRLSLRFLGLGRAAAVEALERGEADLWLSLARGLPATLETVALFDEGYEAVARRGHPRIAEGDAPLNLDAYCAELHVVAAPGGAAGGIMDKSLRRAEPTRRIGISTTGFLSALDIIAGSDMIATVPRRLARAKARTFDLIVRPRPSRPASSASARHGTAAPPAIQRWPGSWRSWATWWRRTPVPETAPTKAEAQRYGRSRRSVPSWAASQPIGRRALSAGGRGAEGMGAQLTTSTPASVSGAAAGKSMGAEMCMAVAYTIPEVCDGVSGHTPLHHW